MEAFPVAKAIVTKMHLLIRFVLPGVDPKTGQTLMRHSTANLTFALYVHANKNRLRAAVDNLPAVTAATPKEAVRVRTGQTSGICFHRQVSAKRKRGILTRAAIRAALLVLSDAMLKSG